MGKQLSRRHKLTILAVLIAAWIAFAAIGALAGWVLAPDDSRRLIAASIGAMLSSFVWVAFCWVFAFVVRGALIRRGYDVPVGAPRIY